MPNRKQTILSMYESINYGNKFIVIKLISVSVTLYLNDIKICSAKINFKSTTYIKEIFQKNIATQRTSVEIRNFLQI